MDGMLTENTQRHRYEMEVDGLVVFTTYRRNGDTVHLLHVEAPPALRGTGAAGRFMRALMERLRADGLKAVPVCSYAAAWLERNKEFADVTSQKGI